jgi:hypothetical protein
MLRQYFASPYQGGDNPLRVGTIAVGTIFYLQDDRFFRHQILSSRNSRSAWIVEAFLNGVVCAARRNTLTGRWEDLYIKGRSDRAILRSLCDSRRKTIAVRLLEAHSALGLTRGGDRYPDLPQAHLVDAYLHRRKSPNLG